MLTSSVTGPVATAVAFVLAVAFGIASSNWEAQRQRYETRIVQLTQAAERTQATLRSQLAACHAAGEDRRATVAGYDASKPPGGARQLLEQQPEGIDACARMESADRAVLSNLKK